MRNRSICLFVVFALGSTGCSTLNLPPGYYQPHEDGLAKMVSESEVSVVYGSCQYDVDKVTGYAETSIVSADGKPLGAYKVYLNPGNRSLEVRYFYSEYQHYYKDEKTIKTELKAGHKYQIIAITNKTVKAGIFNNPQRSIKLAIYDMGTQYTPHREVYYDVDHSNDLVIKELRSVNSYDCRTMPDFDTLFIKPPYRQIFIEQGFFEE